MCQSEGEVECPMEKYGQASEEMVWNPPAVHVGT